ncbi:MAG: CCA tRNA nucleotidyltransferase [Alphaproteobacteria bacterium]|nr:CCA tRNA nucleotidyltransferase [Alphaproteobacteria bacterium]
MAKVDAAVSVKGKTTLKEVLNNTGVKKIFSLFGDDIRCVGGCVRDALASQNMGKENHLTAVPQKLDIDFATTKTPDEIQKVLRENGANIITNQKGLDHGTVFTEIDDHIYEITTLRKDVSTNGHDAEVEFITDWEEDAVRRDFTVNAIYADKDGKIFDKFNGEKDLSIGAVRFIGDADRRVKQDPVRVIRFFRFCAEVGALPMDEKEISEAKTQAEQSENSYMVDAIDDHVKAIEACKNNVSYMDLLTQNRIATEFYKLMGTRNPVHSLKKMNEIGVIDYVFEKDLEREDVLQAQVQGDVGLNLEVLSKMIEIEERAGARASTLCRIVAISNDDNRDGIFESLRISKQKKNSLGEAYKGSLDIGGDSFNPNWLLYKHGAEKALDLVLLSCAKGDLPCEYVSELADKIENWEPVEFPIKGGALKEECGINGSSISDVQKHLEQVWCASGFKFDKSTLLKIAKGNGMN